MPCEYERILVAIDGSRGGEVALKEAIEVARRNDAHLDVLRVMDLNSLEYGGAGIALDGEQIYEIEHESEEYLLDLRRKAIQEDGIVGSTGKNFLQRLVVGSVASYVIRAAKCDVLVARTTEKDIED